MARFLLILGFGLLLNPVVMAQVQVLGVNWGGSGCDFHNMQAVVSPDQREISLLFQGYRVELPQGYRGSVQKSCLIDVDVGVNMGYSFAIYAVDYRGFAKLPSGTQGLHRLALQLVGAGPVPHLREAFLQGFYEGFYFQRVQARRLVFSRCYQPKHRVRILSELYLTRERYSMDLSPSVIDLDSKDWSLRQGIGIVIQPCP